LPEVLAGFALRQQRQPDHSRLCPAGGRSGSRPDRGPARGLAQRVVRHLEGEWRLRRQRLRPRRRRRLQPERRRRGLSVPRRPPRLRSRLRGFAYTTTVDLDGGNGDDRLEGSDNNDNLYAGEYGRDTLIGNAGGDALISEAGQDLLQGGPGNDQLVTTEPCDGHLFDGGTGAADVAGFGRTYYNAVVARIGGTAVKRGVKGCSPTRIRNDNEVLEGTRFADLLYARRHKDLLIGREGNDRCVGGRHLSC
jgi:hypothetical protein